YRLAWFPRLCCTRTVWSWCQDDASDRYLWPGRYFTDVAYGQGTIGDPPARSTTRRTYSLETTGIIHPDDGSRPFHATTYYDQRQKLTYKLKYYHACFLVPFFPSCLF